MRNIVRHYIQNLTYKKVAKGYVKSVWKQKYHALFLLIFVADYTHGI